jgi:hypothetical protein
MVSLPGMNPSHFLCGLQKSLMPGAYSYQRESNGYDVGLVLNMNECLNSDDEENYLMLFSGFGSPHRVSCADAGRSGIEQEQPLFITSHGLISPAYDNKRRINRLVLRYWKDNGLIS